jgi:hypothetical protein
MYNIEEISGDTFKAVPTTYSVQYMYMHDGGPSNQAGTLHNLKVPKCEIFDLSDFPDFYTIKSLRVGDFGVKIKKIFKNI